MKKLFLLLVVAFSFYACGEDKIDVPQVKKQEEKKVDNAKTKDEQSGNEQGNNGNEQGNNGNEQGNNEGNENENNNVVVEFTLADAEKYYEFDKNKVVYYAEQKIKNFKDEKVVDGKTVRVAEVISINRADTDGKITYKIKGTISGQEFDKLFESTGFKKKPERYRVASSLQVKWNNNEEERYKNLDFESLILKKGTEKFTVDNLKDYVEFYATSYSSEKYDLTPEDIEKLKVESIELKGRQFDSTLEMKFSYDGFKSNNVVKLDFNRSKYYHHKVVVNKDFAKGKYMRGVYENLSLFMGDMISYDTNVYAAERNVNSMRNKSDFSNSLNFDFNLNYRDGDVNLVNLTKEITGFKPLSDLKQELQIYSSHDLLEYMKKKVSSSTPDGDVTSKIPAPAVWIKHTQLSLKRDGISKNIYWDKSNNKDYPVEIITGGHEKSMLDVYFERPTFNLISAVLKDGNLTLRVQLVHVNETSIEDAFYDIVVYKVK